MSTFNWSDLIVRLESAGLPLTSIARLVDSRPSTISDLKSGASKSPTGMRAVWLYEMGRDLEAGVLDIPALQKQERWSTRGEGERAA